jgi:arabinogalactan endo-1,4-beta-galactosidase
MNGHCARKAASYVATMCIWLGVTNCFCEEPKPFASGLTGGAIQSPMLLGADISALASGRGPTRTFQENGQTDSELAIMMRHGWNAFRLRVFLSPVRQAPNNSLENTITLAKQIKSAGATFLLDIHYSDTWADPQHQETPVAWHDLNSGELEKRVEQYTVDVIMQLKAAGAMPDMVQVGNEITGGMLWPLGHVRVPPSNVKTDAGRIQPLPEPYDDERQWNNLLRFIKAGVRGVRAASAEQPVKVVIHIDCGGDWPITKWFFDHLVEAGTDFDVIGQSFYPNYHGTLALLEQNMAQCERRYHKPILVAETGYTQSGGDQVTSRKYMQWPGTEDGQLQFMVDLINTVKRSGSGMGVFYWAPEGRRGNGMWTADGSPAPSIFVLDNLEKLRGAAGSHLPPDPSTTSQ